MDILAYTLNGFAVALEPMNLLYTFLGVLMGTILGILPGIGPSAGIALLIPITYGMNPISALIMMCGIYYGTKYGGSATAILIKTPGEASSVMTTLDGYQMARKGRAGAALAIAAVGSFLAGTIGTVALSVFALPLSSMALRFGPAEYFSLMLFSMMAISTLSKKSPGKALFSTMLGLMIGTIGIDLQTGQPRYTMGVTELLDGVEFIVVVVGMFALTEVFTNFERIHQSTQPPIIRISGKLWFTLAEWKRSVGPIWRGGIIGFVVGVLPGAGGTIASILSYVTEKRLSKHPEEFGHGAIEGVAGPEAANNSDSAGSMVPLLALGIPGSGSTAVLMSAFIMYGIQPGPMLFQQRPELVWGLISSMYVGNIMLLILNLPLIGLFVRLLYIPAGILFPLVVVIAAIGTYTISGNTMDLYMVLFFGVIGFLFQLADIPVAPLILALVLGDMMEQSFRRAMTISDGDPMIFLHSGISATLIGLTLVSIAFPFVWARIRPLLDRTRPAA